MEIKIQPGEVMTVPDAAKALGKPKMTLYRWIKSGKMVWVEFGGLMFVPISEVERLKGEEN